jgi:hypothetical protein
MNFGVKERFAISLELNETSGGAWMFGRFCYWIAGRKIGDFDAGVSLRDIFFQLIHIKGDRGHRVFENLFKLPRADFFCLASNALSERDNEISKYVPEDFLPAVLNVCPLVDVFGSWEIFLVEFSGQEKLVFGDGVKNEVHELILPAGEFDRVFEMAYSQLESMYEAATSQ